VNRLQKTTLKITYPVELPQPETLKPVKGEDPYRAVAYHQCRDIFENVAAIFENNKIQTIADLVKWNDDNSEIALPKDSCPNQKDLTETLAIEADPKVSAALHERFRRLGRTEGVDPVFEEHKLDVIAAPADSALCSFAAAAGYPIGLVPMSVLKSCGRPFGLCMIARKRGALTGEETILRFIREWEILYPDRPLPKPMMGL
jgi:amidase